MNSVTSSEMSPGHGADLRVPAEQTSLLYQRAELGLVVAAIVALALAGVLWGKVPRGTLLTWLGFILGLSAARIGLVAAFRSRAGGAATHGRWRALYTVGAAANGLAWGSAAIVLCVPDSFAHQMLVQVAIVGIMASATVVLSSSRLAVGVFLAASSIPLMAGLYVCHTPASQMLAALLVVFVLTMLGVTHRAAQMIDNLLALRFENADLAQRLAAEKTRIDELNEALRVSRDDALASVRVKSEFVANVSHEIRTPINGILGMSELLRATPLTDSQSRYVQAVHRSACHLGDLVNDILDFSKIDADKLELNAAPFDAYALVEDVIEHFALRAHEKRIDLVGVLPPDLAGGYIGDDARLRQVLTNLVSNAIKFTDRGQVVVRLNKRRAGESGARLCFEVSDTGIGIEPHAKARIFESFTQADGLTSRRFGGTGLGLTIVRRLVGLMDGEIDIHSEPGRGSTFQFEIALPPAPDTAPGCGESSQPMNALVVEANPAVMLSLSNSLSAFRISHTLAGSREEAARHYREAQASGAGFDTVFADPHQSCWSAGVNVRSVFADCPGPEPRVVVASRLAEEMDSETRRLSGAGACLSLPARRSRLAQVLRALGADHLPVLDERPGSDHAPADAPSLGIGRVLVAEDNPVNQELVMAMLRRLGIESRLVEDGGEAVRQFEQRSFDIVLMDCQMPHMDGYEATEKIRGIERRRAHPWRTPVVALTANVMAGDRERCLAAGMDDYLCKPFTIAQLHDILMRWSPADRERTAQALVSAMSAPAA